MLSIHKSADLEGLANASNIAVFSVSCLRDTSPLFGKDFRYEKTKFMSQVVVYLGCGGLELNAPASRRVMIGCCPTGAPSTLSWVEEIDERYELSER